MPAAMTRRDSSAGRRQAVIALTVALSSTTACAGPADAPTAGHGEKETTAGWPAGMSAAITLGQVVDAR
ncbi:hypothetical protein [Microbacterium tumbae]